MELREYWEILRRRWGVVLGLTVLALLSSVYSVGFGPQQISSYEVRMSLSLKPQAEPSSATFYTFSDYYGYVASEYLSDDVIKIVEGDAFLRQVQDHLASRPGGPAFGSIKGKKSHRVLEITVTSARAQDALDLAQGTAEILMAKPEVYIGQLTSQSVQVFLIDPPRVVGGGVASRAYLEIGLRALLGLLAGLGLAFLVEYFDDRIRGAAEVERELGLTVLAEIPAEKGRLLGGRPRKGGEGQSLSTVKTA